MFISSACKAQNVLSEIFFLNYKTNKVSLLGKKHSFTDSLSAIAQRAMRTEDRTDKVTRNEVSPSA
jgi:hypothetical protein